MTKITQYQDRSHAGQCLAELLQADAHKNETLILALPRGGVPVAYEIAKRLSLPLDVLIVRKLGLPGQEEYAMGALAADKVIVNDHLIEALQVGQDVLEDAISQEKKELKRRETVYRGATPYPDFQGKTIIVVDDGVATGYTMRAAIEVLKSYKPHELIVAVPVAAPGSLEVLSALGAKVICPLKPRLFQSVGAWYDNFNQVSDEEVLNLLKK